MEYVNSNTPAVYTYNPSGARRTKTVNGTTTNFVWNGSNLAYEKANGKENYYYYDITGITSAKTDGVVKNYLKNSHGDVTAIADSTGTITNDYVYDAFGNEKTENAADTNPFRYAGEYFDAETGQIYLRNRYYDPATGRFISEDPIMDGYNWYVYCGNNPVLFVDPLGLNFSIDEIITENIQTDIIEAIQNLTRDNVFVDSEGCICIDMVEGDSKPLGTELVRMMLGENVDGIIKLTNDSKLGNAVKWDDYDDVIKPVIYLYVPLDEWYVGTYNSDGIYEVAPFTTDLIIAHEFIHIYDSLMGLYIPDTGNGIPTSKAAYMYTDENTKKILSIERTEELNASGIPYFVQIFYDENGRLINVEMGDEINYMNENAIREELEYDIRASY